MSGHHEQFYSLYIAEQRPCGVKYLLCCHKLELHSLPMLQGKGCRFFLCTSVSYCENFCHVKMHKNWGAFRCEQQFIRS